jgi:hypothetical protein
MKKITTFLFVIAVSFMNAQAYKGKGDIKGQAGAIFQSGATGLSVSADFGLGENMSYGFVASYLLSVQEDLIVTDGTNIDIKSPKFTDRADIKVRFNANLGSVIGLDKKMDVYPGLNLGLRNLGGQVGFRYFFTDGFGVFGEAGFPIAKYDKTITGFDTYNNQFTFTAGASFNL